MSNCNIVEYTIKLFTLSSPYYPIPLNIGKGNVLWHKYKKIVYFHLF